PAIPPSQSYKPCRILDTAPPPLEFSLQFNREYIHASARTSWSHHNRRRARGGHLDRAVLSPGLMFTLFADPRPLDLPVQCFDVLIYPASDVAFRLFPFEFE